MLEQLWSSLPVDEENLNNCWIHVFSGVWRIWSKKSEELFAEPIFCIVIFRSERKIIFYKKWIDTGVCYIKNILNGNSTFMSFISFKETFGVSTDYIIYIGCLQAVKCYVRKTGLTVEKISPIDLIKTPFCARQLEIR